MGRKGWIWTWEFINFENHLKNHLARKVETLVKPSPGRANSGLLKSWSPWVGPQWVVEVTLKMMRLNLYRSNLEYCRFKFVEIMISWGRMEQQWGGGTFLDMTEYRIFLKILLKTCATKSWNLYGSILTYFNTKFVKSNIPRGYMG